MNSYFIEATAFAKLFVQEPGTDALIRLMEAVEDNCKLISSATPLEVYAALRRRERAGDITSADTLSAISVLRHESARMVQQPLNPAVLEIARQLLDRTALSWPAAVQLASALAARDMFPTANISFVSASAQLLEAAKKEGLEIIDPTRHVAEPAKELAEPLAGRE